LPPSSETVSAVKAQNYFNYAARLTATIPPECRYQAGRYHRMAFSDHIKSQRKDMNRREEKNGEKQKVSSDCCIPAAAPELHL